MKRNGRKSLYFRRELEASEASKEDCMTEMEKKILMIKMFFDDGWVVLRRGIVIRWWSTPSVQRLLPKKYETDHRTDGVVRVTPRSSASLTSSLPIYEFSSDERTFLDRLTASFQSPVDSLFICLSNSYIHFDLILFHHLKYFLGWKLSHVVFRNLS